MRWSKTRIAVVAVVTLIVIIIATNVASGEGDEPTRSAAPPPAAAETPSAPAEPEPDPEPVTLGDWVLMCNETTAEMTMMWGQAPGLIYSGDPRVTGELQPGDKITILTPRPNEHGEIRVKVFPYDYRAVGKTNDQVWIDWASLERTDIASYVFRCER